MQFLGLGLTILDPWNFFC